MSRLRDFQRIKTKVIRAENPQTETSDALIEQETIEENELWRIHVLEKYRRGRRQNHHTSGRSKKSIV